jgi:heptosyltransferase-2
LQQRDFHVVRFQNTGMATVPQRMAIFAPNWLGDAVMALPAMADVRHGAPLSSLTVVARPAVAPLFQMASGIDRVVAITGDRRQAADTLRAQQFEAALLLPNSFQSALIAWRSGIPERWGYRGDYRSPLLTHAVSKPAGIHQAASYQHLVRELGFENGARLPRIEASADVRRAAAAWLAEEGWNRQSPLVALAPGAANGRAKQWPPSSFAMVITRLVEKQAVPVIVGAPADADAAQAVVGALAPPVRDRVISLAGRTDLSALAGVLVHCQALITNDSGGMHFAAALGIPVTAMFGPSNEEETRPLGAGVSTILTNPVWCRPCMLRDCPIDHRCMRAITPDQVLAATAAHMAI